MVHPPPIPVFPPSGPSCPQANLFLVPDPAAWVMSIESPTWFDFFHALSSILMTVLLPMLLSAAITSYFMTDPVVFDAYLLQAKAQLTMHLSMFFAWLQDNPIHFVLFLYLFLLLGVVVVSHRFTWFSVDTNPHPQSLHHANSQSHHQASKPHCRFKRVHPKAPILTRQAELHHFQHLQYSVDTILLHICNLATSCALLPCKSCATSHSVACCGRCCVSHPDSASHQCNDLPFCPHEFGKHVHHSLEGDIGCTDTVTHRINDVCKPKCHASKWKSVQEYVTMNDVQVC